MKKLSLVLVLAAASLMQSCMKCDHDFDRPKPHITTDAVSASIGENTTYTYTLPSMAKGSMSYVTTAAAHGASSIVADANGNLIYSYTPAQNYTGSDVVVITTSNAGGNGGCFGGNNSGLCNNNQGGHNCGHDDNTIITTISITVTGNKVAAVAKAAPAAQVD